MATNSLQKTALIYLYLVPPVVAAIGFGIGPVSYLIYLPIWAVNVCLMTLAVWQINTHKPTAGETKAGEWTSAALLLIIPWLLFSIFAGMGPPPHSIAGWLATAIQQQARYTILIVGGVSALLGFALLKMKLEALGETVYSVLGFTALGIAIPLFILNMAFWGYYLTEAFRVFATLPIGKRPDWYRPIMMTFYVISIVEVALIYFATMLFAIGLKKTGILSKRASAWYVVISIIGILFVVLPPSCPQPFATAAYLSAIPAIPFIMPYLMGVRLLRFHKVSA